MIQLVINTNMLRELDERRLINTYARLVCMSDEDISNRNIIRENLSIILDWDYLGDKGLGIYCSKFENLKRIDWEKLIDFIIDNSKEIKIISSKYKKAKIVEKNKEILDAIEQKNAHDIEKFTDENYKVSGRGKKAKPCIYEGRHYKSRKECQFKEGLTYRELYKYLARTHQLEPTSTWTKEYG